MRSLSEQGVFIQHEFHQYPDRKVKIFFNLKDVTWDEAIKILDKSKNLFAKHVSGNGKRLINYTYVQNGSLIDTNIKLQKSRAGISIQIYPSHNLWTEKRPAILEASTHISYLFNSTSL